MAAQADGFRFDTDAISSTWQGTSATVAADDAGEAIGRINDLRVGSGSPHNGIQATGTLKPTRQTTGAKFDGNDDNWLTNYTAGAGENFIVALVDVPAVIAATQVIAGTQDIGGNRFWIGFEPTGYFRARAGFGTHMASTDLRGQTVIVGFTVNGSLIRMFTGDAEVVAAAQGGTPNTAVPLRAGALNLDGAANSYFGGSIKKLVAGRQFLDLATYRKIRNSLLA